MNFISEDMLIERCRRGDAEAFGPLIKNYRRRLFSYLIKLSGEKNTADDLFQETLIKAWKGIPRFAGQSKFSSWLFSIAHNTAIDHLRKKIKNRNFEIGDGDTDNISDQSNPHIEYVTGETNSIVMNAVEKLSVKQKNVVLLRIHGRMSFKEIAELTGEPLNTVISHMHYAVKKLKKYLRHQDAG